jgi:hypothetical protein
MATESLDARAKHVRSITVTTIAALAGVGAAVASAVLTASMETAADAATASDGLLALAVFVSLQFPLLRLLGVDVQDFGAKDILFVVFMTFSLWFVTWAILLTSGAYQAF